MVQEEVLPALNTEESSFPGGPGSRKGLGSLRCGRLDVVFVGCLPEGEPKEGGFLTPLVVGHGWPASDSRGSAGRKPSSASQHKAKSRFRHTQTWGLSGPFLIKPRCGFISQGGQQTEDVCGGERTLPMAVTRPKEKAHRVHSYPWSSE